MIGTFREYINQNYKEYCTGCGACAQKCAAKALTLKKDDLGYFTANFNAEKCVNCNACEGVCPILFDNNVINHAENPECYAVQMSDDIRAESSSGGVFTAVAQKIIADNGIVFGAAWTASMEVAHIGVEENDEISKLRGSKYLQSYIGDSYRYVKKQISTGRKVLFSGTPCQVAGLYAFLGSDYENLFTVDLLCFSVPSQDYFKSYLSEQFPDETIVSCNMRDKTQGWKCTLLSVTTDEGKTFYRSLDDDYYEKAFHNRLLMSEHCKNCKFCSVKRQGDISLGDFWGITKLNSSYDNRGTNAVLVNSKKGKYIFESIIDDSLKYSKQSVKNLAGNRIEKLDHMIPHKNAKRFHYMYKKYGFLRAASDCINNNYDIGIVGCWEIKNYGSHLTYYALYKVLESLGFESVLIGCPSNAEYKSVGVPELFKEIPYHSWEMLPQYSDKIAMREVNCLADCFIVGSDQLWNDVLYRYFGEFAYLDFVFSNKRKISYSTSFGKTDWIGSDIDRQEISYYLKRFDSISVRETSGVSICKEKFGVQADWTLDPIFLCDKSVYLDLAKKSNIHFDEDYIAAYILDYSKEKEDAIRYIANKLMCKCYIITDPNKQRENEWTLNIESGYTVEDWIKWIADSKFVVTDSYHGMCVSIMLQKQFIAIVNAGRGAARFIDYGEKLSISNRIVNSAISIIDAPDLLDPIDYRAINNIIESERKRCIDWLYSSSKAEKNDMGLSDFDVLSLKFEKYMQLQHKKELERKPINQCKKLIGCYKKTIVWRGLRYIKHNGIFSAVKKLKNNNK